MTNKTTTPKSESDFIERLFDFFYNITVGLYKFISTSTREAYLGFKNGLMPEVKLCKASCVISLFFCLKIDFYLLKLAKYFLPSLTITAPMGLLRVVVWILAAVSPFIFWGWRRHKIVQVLIKFFEDSFTAAGLISNGRTPRLIREYVTETNSKVLQFLSDGITVTQMQEKKEILENKLSVRIDNIRGNPQFPKLIEIEFSEDEMKTLFELTDISGYRDFTFPIGATRTEVVIGDLKKIPHYLFAGQTGSGKTTFIKTMISVLLANNKDIRAYFIDLKGTDAALFIGFPNVSTTTDVRGALNYVESVEREMNQRKTLFQKEKVIDINAYNLKMKKSGRSQDCLPRILLIVDEMACLMPQLATTDFAAIKKAGLILNLISRTARSFGVHLFVCLQKPDTRNMDSTIKANLEGVLCFQVSNRTQSQVVLDSVSAAGLGGIKGRAVWKTSVDEVIVQTPIIPDEIFNKFFERIKKDGNGAREKNISGASEGQRDSEGITTTDEDCAWNKINERS